MVYQEAARLCPAGAGRPHPHLTQRFGGPRGNLRQNEVSTQIKLSEQRETKLCFKVSIHFFLFCFVRKWPLRHGLAPFSDLLEIETALPEIETALSEIKTVLPGIKTALPEIETLFYKVENN